MSINGLAKFTLLTFLQKYSGIQESEFLKAHNVDTDKPNSILVFERCTKVIWDFLEPQIFVMNWHELQDKDTGVFGPVAIGKVQRLKQIYLPAPCLSSNHGYFYWDRSQGLTYMNRSENGTKIQHKEETKAKPTEGLTPATPGDVFFFGELEGLLLSPNNAYQQLVKR